MREGDHAVENLVFAKAWRAAGHTQPPHYELHAWLYRENPAGTFAQLNPRATCAHHQASTAHAHR